MRSASAFFAGFIFALGLGIAGMTRPTKVIGFLDVASGWDPTLLFVMVGAIAVYAPLYRLILKRRKVPLFEPRFTVPETRDVDRKLVLGAALFGIGWGLGGYCPGPAVTALARGSTEVFVFVIAMLAGMGLHAFVTAPRAPGRAPTGESVLP
jgi:hypothetical protein